MDHAIKLLLLSFTVGASGCALAPAPVAPAGQTSARSAPPGPAPTAPPPVPPVPAVPAAPPPGPGTTLPGPIGGNPGQPGNPPLFVVPAPSESRQLILELVAKYGLRSIGGPGATLENLRVMDRTYQRLPRESFRDLSVVIQPTNPRDEDAPEAVVGGDGGGVYEYTDTQGRVTAEQRPSATTPGGGRITYIGARPGPWPYVHEVGHHITLYLDRPFGLRTLEALRYRAQGPAGEPVHANETEFDPSGVDQRSFPSEYAQGSAGEHLAELVAEHLVSDSLYNAAPLLPGFDLDAGVRRLLTAKLGARRPASPEPGT